MTREEYKNKLIQPNSGSEAFNKGVKQANSRANRLFKNIFDDFESRVCGNCIYYAKETSVCINAGSPLCADFVDSEYGCNLFEREK